MTNMTTTTTTTTCSGTTKKGEPCKQTFDTGKGTAGVWYCGHHRSHLRPQDAPDAAPRPVIMDGIAGILAGTTTVEQVKADADAILNREITPPTRVEREIAAILEEAQHNATYAAEIAALDDVERLGQPAIGPEFGEMLPKIFTDEIRQRIARQQHAGASMPELAVAWGRTLGSIKKILARFPTGQPAIA